MKKFKRIAERRQIRTATMTVTAGRSLAEALRIAASMTPEQQKQFVEEQLASMGKSKLQFLAGTAGEAMRKVKDIFKKTEAAFDGLRDVKDQRQEPSPELKSNLQKISNEYGVAALVLLAGSALLSWFFEDHNIEIMHLLKPILLSFGGAAVFLISKYATKTVLRKMD